MPALKKSHPVCGLCLKPLTKPNDACAQAAFHKSGKPPPDPKAEAAVFLRTMKELAQGLENGAYSSFTVSFSERRDARGKPGGRINLQNHLQREVIQCLHAHHAAHS